MAPHWADRVESRVFTSILPPLQEPKNQERKDASNAYNRHGDFARRYRNGGGRRSSWEAACPCTGAVGLVRLLCRWRAGYGSGNLGTVKTGTTGTGNLRGMVTAGNGIKGPAIGPGAVSQSGYVSGGFVGVQKQRGNMVLGIEADFGPSSLSGSSDSRGTTLSISR